MIVSPLSLGIDIGGTKSHGLVLDATDQVLAQRVLPTQPTAEGVRSTVSELARALADDLQTTPASFSSIGLGIPGLVDHAHGIVETAVNLGIARCDLAGLFSTDFSVQVRVENDLKATALGAGLVLGPPTHDLAYVNLGTGLSAAAMCNGELIRGLRNGAGEIGHLAIDPAGEPCSCGQLGCLETVLGGQYVAPRLAAQGLNLSELDQDQRDSANTERTRIVSALATTLTLVASAYDPTAIVLGGGVIAAAPWLPDAVGTELRNRAAGSAFLSRLAIHDRLVILPPSTPVAAIGAALVGRSPAAIAVSSLEG